MASAPLQLYEQMFRDAIGAPSIAVVGMWRHMRKYNWWI